MAVIYIDGPHGNLPIALLAQANSESNSALTYGLIKNNIGSMSSGVCVEAGRLEDLNTDVSGWAEGDTLYLSPTTPGGITNVKPTAPNHMVIVGTLVRKHPAQGVIQVKIQNGYELNELHNVSINGSLANNDTLVYDYVNSLWKNSSVLSTKLTKGTKTIVCIDNGDYATGQAAIDAASAGDTILFGAKSGGWGDLNVPAGKKFSIKGLQSHRCPFVQVGAIIYSPTTGTHITENELYLDSLYISSSASNCVTFGGTAPARIRINNCYINATGATANAIILSNTWSSGGLTSSAYVYDSVIMSASTSNYAIDSSTPYVRIYGCAIDAGNTLLRLNSGTLESDVNSFNGRRVGEIVNVTGGNFLSGRSLFSNTTTNGSGVLVASGGVFANSQNTFSVATGTGYCVRGAGVHLYGPYVVANSALLAYNVKIQNTLTSVAYTTAFTSSP